MLPLSCSEQEYIRKIRYTDNFCKILTISISLLDQLTLVLPTRVYFFYGYVKIKTVRSRYTFIGRGGDVTVSISFTPV